MAERYLVAYASGSGSTAEVAAAIGAALAADVSVDVLSVDEIADVAGYAGVVVGSSIRQGRWLPEAAAFVERFAPPLAQRPVAYFTTCMTLVDNNTGNRQTVLNYLAPVIRMAPQINPIGLGLFAGSLHPQPGVALPETLAVGDFRDWEQIRAWAAAIGREMRQQREGILLVGGVGLRPNAADELEQVAFDLEEMAVDGRDLSGIQLPAAQLEQTTLKGARLANAELPDASLGWAELQEADLRRSNLHNANLIGANCHRANLHGANLTHAVLNGAILTQADLGEANLSGADLNWADLSGASLQGAILREANLCWANLTGCDLDSADLVGMLYNDKTQWPADFQPPAQAVAVRGLG
jgi:menaquinone-dependent protoporphyrinogen IX oxidase